MNIHRPGCIFTFDTRIFRRNVGLPENWESEYAIVFLSKLSFQCGYALFRDPSEIPNMQPSACL